jgi:hypothetical protein
VLGALWILKNIKYVWKNRLKYRDKAIIDERSLKYRMIKINIPSSIYLVPRLRNLYFKNEADKFKKNLFYPASTSSSELKKKT